MKKTVTLFTLLLSLILSAQELRFEDVIKVDSTVTKEELYNRARSWYADTYKSEKDVMSITDKELGEKSGNGEIWYEHQKFYAGVLCAKGYVMYKINIYVKDGRYKYNFHSFVHEGTRCSGGGGLVSFGILTQDKEHKTESNKGWREVKDLVNVRIENLINSLSEAMNKKHEASNDW
ncbi:DUF4468 domain-containing protein [Chryseobacterium sp.]|uniref:DUF4468 domain-containing protein n=1 Tax=Chryseobacterium sp. TaxID=1871047 RepID=UPI0024E220A2|nr:DUF4468 domain-containing protein [Chryseobacterium sp.]